MKVTVGEIRKLIADMPDDAPVLIYRPDFHDDDEDEYVSTSAWIVSEAQEKRIFPGEVFYMNWDISIFDNDFPGSIQVLVLSDMDTKIPSYEVTRFQGDPFGAHGKTLAPKGPQG